MCCYSTATPLAQQASGEPWAQVLLSHSQISISELGQASWQNTLYPLLQTHCVCPPTPHTQVHTNDQKTYTEGKLHPSPKKGIYQKDSTYKKTNMIIFFPLVTLFKMITVPITITGHFLVGAHLSNSNTKKCKMYLKQGLCIHLSKFMTNTYSVLGICQKKTIYI